MKAFGRWLKKNFGKKGAELVKSGTERRSYRAAKWGPHDPRKAKPKKREGTLFWDSSRLGTYVKAKHRV